MLWPQSAKLKVHARVVWPITTYNTDNLYIQVASPTLPLAVSISTVTTKCDTQAKVQLESGTRHTPVHSSLYSRLLPASTSALFAAPATPVLEPYAPE